MNNYKKLPILNIDFDIGNKSQTKQTKHLVTGDFCSNLDLNTAHKKPSWSVCVEIFVCTVLLRRAESCSQLPFLYHLSTMYLNSR